MDGIFGWLGEHGAHQDLIRHMGRAAHAATAALSPATVIADAEALLGRLAEGDPHVPATIAPA
jgi:hypothetical protein